MAKLEKDSLRISFTGREEENATFAKMRATSAAINYRNPNADLTGAILEFPAADGYATYVVTKNSPLTLQHIQYCDGYTIPAAHVRGLERSDVVDALHHRKCLVDLFANKV